MKFIKLQHTNIHLAIIQLLILLILILTNASVGLSSWNSVTVALKQYTLMHVQVYIHIGNLAT